jgi:hypothetical protein
MYVLEGATMWGFCTVKKLVLYLVVIIKLYFVLDAEETECKMCEAIENLNFE